MNILVIGDAHARPGVSNDRFSHLGKIIVDLQPDVVVDMGDWADMESLCSYDGSTLTGGSVKKTSFEGRRYKADIEVAVEARDRVHQALQAAGRKRPRRIALGGNHDDDRFQRVKSLVPELEGIIDVKDLQIESYGWERIPFGQSVDLGGFEFKHYFTSGVMGRPTSGEYPAAQLLKSQFRSCVAGHDHIFNEAHRTANGGRRIQAFKAGCFLDPEQTESYAREANDMWSKGLLFMQGVQDGVCTDGFLWLSAKAIKREYSK
jgi:hypothetical protein